MPHTYTPAAGVHFLRSDGRSLIYAEALQQVLLLNETADKIWRALTNGSVEEAARGLQGCMIGEEQAVAVVEQAASEWTFGGFLAPSDLDEALREPADRNLAIGDLRVELRAPAAVRAALDPILGHHYATPGAPSRRVTVIEYAGRQLIYLERRFAAACPREGLAPDLKAVLSEMYAEAAAPGFLTHGALLTRPGKRLLLSGPPGAGKSTLAVALAHAGWAYGGDDIVHIAPNASAQGAPFAATLKAGSWPLLEKTWPQLTDLPSWTRSDGQTARYLLPASRDMTASGAINTIVLLTRRPGSAARASLLSSLGALAAIVENGWSPRWRMTGEALANLAASVERATCVQLEYSDLGAAIGVIGEVAGVEASAA